MITDEVSRELTPEKRSVSPERLLARVAMTLGFTAVQLWAILELAALNTAGTALVALVAVISAAILVTATSWKEIVTLVLERSTTDSDRERD